MKRFNEIYEEIYKNNNAELEKIRKSILKKIILITVVAIIVILYFIKDEGICALAIMISMIVETIVITNNKGKYTKIFKSKVIETFVKNLDSNLNYYYDRGIAAAIYRKAEFEKFNIYSSECLIEGLLDGKHLIKMAEVHTEKESKDSEGNSIYTLFHGIFGYIECSKDMGITLKIRSDKRKKLKESKIEMDSDEFERNFDVYAENEVIAMQILTSDIMEMMIEFKEASKIKYELTIKQGHIYIRFYIGKVFEPKLFSRTLNYGIIKRYYDIIKFIFEISSKIATKINNIEI